MVTEDRLVVSQWEDMIENWTKLEAWGIELRKWTGIIIFNKKLIK